MKNILSIKLFLITFVFSKLIVAQPTTVPVSPTVDAASVISIYSDAYTDVATQYNPNWGQSGSVNQTYDPIGGGANFVMAYTNMNYQGTILSSGTNALAMEYLHIDIWIASGVDEMIKATPINDSNGGTGVGEILMEVPVTPGSWNSVDIAKSSFTGMTWDKLKEFKFERFNADGSAGGDAVDIYIDNVYFWNDNPTESLIINDFNTPLEAGNFESGGEWYTYEESDHAQNFATLSQIPAIDVPNHDSPVMLFNWGLATDLSWGGYVGVYDIFDTPMDLSGYNNLSFKINNLSDPSSWNGSQPDVEFRVILWDISDVEGEYTSRSDVETWWAFFKPNIGESPIMNDSQDGWIEYRIPLVDNGQSDDLGGYKDGFANPGAGWGVSIAGNDALDLDQIGGIAIEIVHGGDFAITQGEFLVEDLQAIYSVDVPGCTEETACNYNPDATVDDNSCYDCIEVGFSVNMAEEETHPDGVYFAGGDFGQEGLLMDDADGDDVWHVTVKISETDAGTTKLFKFRNQPSFGTWNGFEDTGGLIAGGCNTGTYNDRFFIVPTLDSAFSTVCYGSCVDCLGSDIGCTEETACNYNPDATTDDGSCYDCIEVGFSVNMEEEETHPEGVYIAGGDFGQEGLLMDDADGDDIWHLTLKIPETDAGTTKLFKFRNQPSFGTWNGFEDTGGLIAGGCNVGEYNDRFFTVPDLDSTFSTVCYGSCFDCIEDYAVDVAFNVDMNGVDGFIVGTDVPYVFGSYNNWDNFSSQDNLIDSDGDGIYTGTVTGFMFNDSVTVLYGYGQTNEEVPAICGIADPELGLYVRELPLIDAGGDSLLVLDPVSFGQCPTDNSPKVHLKVDVSSIITSWSDPTTLCVVGGFNGWQSACFAEMLDEDGDNIYEVVIGNLVVGESYEFKFLANEGWNNPLTESGAPANSSCDFNPNDDNYNYGFTATEGVLDLGVFDWNGCNSLSNDMLETIIPTEFSSKAYPNPFNPYVNISYKLPKAENVRVDIVNLLGQNVKTLVNTMQTPGSYTYKWNGEDKNGLDVNTGMYFAIISRKSGRDILKITYLK